MDNVLIKDVIMGVRLTLGVDEIYTVDPDDNISLQSIIQDRQELIDTRRTRKEKNAQQSKNCARIIEDHIAADCDGVVRTVVVPTEHDGDERRSKRKRRVIIRNGC